MQVQQDWFQYFPNSETLEKDIGNFKFKGLGFYLTKTDTVLIVSQGTGLGFYCYNCPFAETIFAKVAEVPVQEDSR